MTVPVLVTGAAGFIGSHVCRALLDAGLRVVGFDNFDPFYDRTIKDAALKELRKAGPDSFVFVEGDIREMGPTRSALDGVGAVVHLAARAGVRPSIEDPVLYESVNLGGTVTLLEACRDAGVSRFLFGSSSSVYGDDTPAPFREDAPCDRPISPYAATKRAGELLAHTYAHLYGFRVACLRFFTVYGPRQRPDLAIHRFTRMLAAGEAIPQYGDGSTERDYTWVDDIVAGVRAALDWTEGEGTLYDTFNLGGSRTVRLDTLIQLIGEALGVEPVVRRLPMVPGDVRATSADITKSHDILGYTPSTSIEEGITRFVDWYRTQD